MKSEVVVREFQRLLDPGTVAGLTERQVLERFAERGDPVAFEAIVTRHGPMVYTVCRQLLRDSNDVDDAAQATFLILIKKAGTLRRPERLGPWLYGVANRVAHRLRTRSTTTELPENLAGPRLACPVEDNEQLAILHDEIERLPEKYRVPIVLCCIEGLSHDEAASRLGWPIGTVHGRLSRARERLRDRLTRRGVILSGGVPDLLARTDARQIILPEPTRLAVLALVRGTVPASLEILTKGVLSTMIIEKLKQMGIAVVITLIGLGTVTTALRAYQAAPGDPRGSQGKQAHAGWRAKPDARRQRSPPRPRPLRTIVRCVKITKDWRRKSKLKRPTRKWTKSLQTPHYSRWSSTLQEKELKNQSILLINLEPPKTSAQGGAREAVIEEQDRMLHQLNSDKRMYTEKWRQLAQQKRQIARQSRSLGVAVDSSPNGIDLGRRLDELEQKIDRIIDSLPPK